MKGREGGGEGKGKGKERGKERGEGRTGSTWLELAKAANVGFKEAEEKKN